MCIGGDGDSEVLHNATDDAEAAATDSDVSLTSPLILILIFSLYLVNGRMRRGSEEVKEEEEVCCDVGFSTLAEYEASSTVIGEKICCDRGVSSCPRSLRDC